MGGVVVKVLRY